MLANQQTAVVDPAVELAQSIAAANPGRRFAHTDATVGVWTPVAGQFLAVATLLATGEWVAVDGLPLLNGKPAIADEAWREVEL